MEINTGKSYLSLLLILAFLGIILRFQGVYFYTIAAVVLLIGIGILIKRYVKW